MNHNLAGHVPLKTENAFINGVPPPTVPPRTLNWSENGPGRPMTVDGLNDYSRPATLGMRQDVQSYETVHHQHQQMPGLHQGIPPNHELSQTAHIQAQEMSAPGPLSGFSFVQGYGPAMMHGMSSANRTPNEDTIQQPSLPLSSANAYSTYDEGGYPYMSPQDPQLLRSVSFARNSESSLASMGMTASPAADSPGWLSLPSPSSSGYHSQQPVTPPSILRYPVLQPLLPSIAGVLPISLACELLELYFASSTSAHLRPLSPYLLAYVFRKRSFLHPTRPRVCSPALLCSMLWVAAQTSDAPFLTSLPATRGKICQKLLELTVDLLRPLIHGCCTSDGSPNLGINTVVDGTALDNVRVATPNQDHVMAQSSGKGSLDDVVTYIHLATVVSASEYKAASLRWWNAAWCLARELKLSRELPLSLPKPLSREPIHGEDADGDYDLEMADSQTQQTRVSIGPSTTFTPSEAVVSEEEREERRRVWWLLYTMDRHLAFCYNRPLCLLDAECEGLFQPIDDSVWQAGEFFSPRSIPGSPSSQRHRRRGPCFECTGHSIFGFFTPLMTILGEIVDLHHARNHPRFGVGCKGGNEWDDRAAEITQQLERYEQSLKEFEARAHANLHRGEQNQDGSDYPSINTELGTPSIRSPASATARTNEALLQTRTVVAYGTDVIHVLHIALTGKWDPISLLDDNDLWISSQPFITATGHAVSAAEAVGKILECDPDLIFMPFFFGMYLLQGSFLLLLIADKLQGEASQSVVRACETIVRAHEACIVTLNTEYQRNFRKVMRSALAQVKGRISEDFGEKQLRRREVLALYRWTGDGTGLAL
ncbi:hypothetical protein MMC30_007544 [Trapelia coarctata]|nr:hypothetical protein [Trapelia coarctata]